MKNAIKYLLQKILGFRSYLFVFSLFKIYTLRKDKKENDFFCFLKMIPDNSIVLDIGANIGIMTVHLAKRIKNVEVFSFEPIPYNVSILNRVIRFFKLENVRVFEFALGNEDGYAEMIMPVINAVKMQGLSHVVHSSITENNHGESFKIKIRKLDSLEELKNQSKKVSAIKMDVENFEFFVLEGGKGLLKQHQPLIYIELWENQNREKCFELIKNLGYDIYVTDKMQTKLFDKELHKTQNFIFSVCKKTP